jgi:hypothetical protein
MPNYPRYFEKANITRGDAIAAIKDQYPLFSKPTMTMVCNEEYGVQLLPDAEMILATKFGLHEGLSIKGKRKKEKRAKPNKLCVRLDDAMFARFEAAFCNSSFVSRQDMLEAAISMFMERMEGAA